MVCVECGGNEFEPVFHDSGLGQHREYVPTMRDYGRVGSKPAHMCKKCCIIHCNIITSEKVYELGGLLGYLRTEHGLDKVEEKSLRIILSNRSGTKHTYFKRNLKGLDLDYAVKSCLSMVRCG